MICNSVYDSFDAIPEALRGEFENVGGKYQLKADAIPGVGQLFNSALAANERKAVDQVKARNTRIRELEEKISGLEDQLAVTNTPGAVTLSQSDAKNWDKYTALGSVKDLEDMKSELETLKSTVGEFQLKEALDDLTTGDDALNAEVLKDWATSKEGEGLEFFAKTIESTDDKGAKVSQTVPYVRIEKTNDKGKIEVVEKELLTHARETLPAWKFEALTATADPQKVNQRKVTTPVAPGVVLPNLGKATAKPSPDQKTAKPVDTFNSQRDKARNPFMPAAQKATP